jgi:UDP-N-acetylmuramoylalanine--D-glutamate ligase
MTPFHQTLQRKIIIVGGYDRLLDLSELLKKIKNERATIKKLLLIGASRERVKLALDSIDYKNYEIIGEKTLASIVKRAAEIAETGDAVVLSPGFPSFDMFKDFEERGRAFNAAVGELK